MALSWNYGDLLEAVGRRVPDRTALIHGSLRRSWGELDRRSNRLARAMLDTPGIDTGSHVAFYMTNRPEYSEALTAAFKARLVHLNINFRYVDDDLFDLLTSCDADIIVYESEFADRIERLAPKLTRVKSFIEAGDPVPRFCGAVAYEQSAAHGDDAALGIERSGDDLFFLLTGGTTGTPKAVMWRQQDRLAVYKQGRIDEPVEEFLDRMLARRGERVLPASPLMHSTGVTVATRALVAGGSVVTVPGSFDAAAIWEAAAAGEVTALSIVGDVFARPLLEALDDDLVERLGSLEYVTSAGVVWSRDNKEALLARMPRLVLVDTFGSSEGSGLGSSVSTAQSMSQSTATFRIGNGVKVFTPDHQEVVPGSCERGLIAKSGPIPLGYYNDPQRSAATFPVIDGVRYSIPGDWCTVADDGTITLLGRGDHCINSGGEKIFPEEVEQALCTLDGIGDALVVGLRDPVWGESVAAAVSTSLPLDSAGVREALRGRLAGFKMPRRLIEVEQMPRTPSGKPDYQAVRRLFSSDDVGNDDLSNDDVRNDELGNDDVAVDDLSNDDLGTDRAAR